MIDETKIIKRLQNRIDVFVASNPKEKNSPVVETIREFIHMLQLEAEQQAKVEPSLIKATTKHEVKDNLETRTVVEQQENIKNYNDPYSDPIYDTSRTIIWDMDSFIEEFEMNFEDTIDLLESIIKNYHEALSTEENQKKLDSILQKSAERIRKLNIDF